MTCIAGGCVTQGQVQSTCGERRAVEQRRTMGPEPRGADDVRPVDGAGERSGRDRVMASERRVRGGAGRRWPGTEEGGPRWV